MVEERKNYYEKLVNDGWNTGEILSFSLDHRSYCGRDRSHRPKWNRYRYQPYTRSNGRGGRLGGSPTVNVQLGGRSVTSGLTKAAEVTKGIASILQIGAAMSSTAASYSRREEEWDFQKRMAEKNSPRSTSRSLQPTSVNQMADIDLRNHDKQKENLEKDLEYMQSKFTNQELYDWMITQMSTLYFQSYQLAFDVAKRAERCFRYELGLSNSNYIQFGYWDSLKKGLLSARSSIMT